MGKGRAPNTIADFWRKVDVKGPDDCWNWQASIQPNGYGQFKMKNKKWLTHRLAYHSEHGFIPPNMLVCHSCDNKQCCNPAHLFLGSYDDNSKDMVHKGRSCKGEKNGNSKLTDSQVLEIITKYDSGNYSQRALAREYNVNKKLISLIRKREIWTHLTNDQRFSARI